MIAYGLRMGTKMARDVITVGLSALLVYGGGCTAAPASEDLGAKDDELVLQGLPRVMAQVDMDTVGFQPATQQDGSKRLEPSCNVRRGGTFAVSAITRFESEHGWVHVVPFGQDMETQISAKSSVAAGFWLRSEDVILVAVDDDSGQLTVAEARDKIAGIRNGGTRYASPFGISNPGLNISRPTQYRLTEDGELEPITRAGIGDLLVGASPDLSDAGIAWTVQGADGYLVARTSGDAERLCASHTSQCASASDFQAGLSVNWYKVGFWISGVALLFFGLTWLINRTSPHNATVRVQNTTQIEPAMSLYAVTPFGQAGQGGAPPDEPTPAPPLTGEPPVFAEKPVCWSPPDSNPCRYTLPPLQSTWYCLCLRPGQMYSEAGSNDDVNGDGDSLDQCGYLNFMPGTWENACAVNPPGVAEGSPCQVSDATCAHAAFFSNAP